ncbi:MAG: NAD(P)-dependent oxidoreductase [Candidatus Marsarchaeota archaeon]|nr:NAD(P)-dependent oxidoreductase [Candidatus Marsarchaeota archaeon]
MKVLVTGGGGYLGSALVPMLLEEGYEVTVLDRFFFGKKSLSELPTNKLHLVREDVRWTCATIFEGIDAVVDLAALCETSVGELLPWKTMDINYLGRYRIARFAKFNGVKKYIMTSTSSVYGMQEGILNETSAISPNSTYSEAAAFLEHGISRLNGVDFSTTILRPATYYGMSGNMRFDLPLNSITIHAMKNAEIMKIRDGEKWRPMVHVKDVANAILLVLKADSSIVKNQVFNVGSDEQNYLLGDLSEFVTNATGIKNTIAYPNNEKRSHKLDFSKIKETLGFSPKYALDDGIKEITAAYDKNNDIDSPETYRLQYYKYLLDCNKVSEENSLHGTIL